MGHQQGKVHLLYSLWVARHLLFIVAQNPKKFQPGYGWDEISLPRTDREDVVLKFEQKQHHDVIFVVIGQPQRSFSDHPNVR